MDSTLERARHTSTTVGVAAQGLTPAAAQPCDPSGRGRDDRGYAAVFRCNKVADAVAASAASAD